METRGLINVGDEIKNHEKLSVTVSSVTKGTLGLLIKGAFSGALLFEGYIPWELPPRIDKGGWHGWAEYSSMTLADGMEVGALYLPRFDKRDEVEEYDLEWQRTINAIREEERVN